jgi:hypothetical protein
LAELENWDFMKKRSRTKFILIIFAILAFNSIAFPQTTNQTKEQKIKLAGKAGDRFVKRFRETLDFGIVFDEMASKKALEVVGKGLANFGSVNKKYFEKQTGDLKEEIFKAEIGAMYLTFVFYWTFSNETDKTKPDFYLPSGYSRLVKSFKFLNGFSEDSTRENTLPIQTDKNLRIYLQELKIWSKFLKKHLPKKFYTLPLYKKNLEDTIFIPKVSVSDGDSYFEVPNGIDVFQVVRDTFCIDFIEEDGKMKILGIIIGN